MGKLARRRSSGPPARSKDARYGNNKKVSKIGSHSVSLRSINWGYR